MKNDNIIIKLLLQHIDDGFGDRLALCDEYSAITYNQLNQYMSSVIDKFPQLKTLPQKSSVLLISDDSISAVIFFLSLIFYGHMPCFINPKINNRNLEHYMSVIQPDCLLIADDYYKKFIHSNLGGIRTIHFNDDLHSTSTLSSIDVENQPSVVDAKHGAFYAFSSGTTDLPLAILHRHQDVDVMNDTYVKNILDVNRKSRLFSSSKLFFTYGLNSLLIALYNGATAILSPKKLNGEVLWGMINKYKPTVYFSTPSAYYKLLQTTVNEDGYYPEQCVSAGESLPETIYFEWKNKYGGIIIDGIGCTEVMSTFISNKKDDAKPGCSGRVVPGFKCKLSPWKTDPNKKVLWVKGNTYPHQYVNNISATKERFINDWFITNDLYSVDENGYYKNEGRVNDLIYSRGCWVSPKRLEDRIKNLNIIQDCVVIGKKNHEYDTTLIAYVLLYFNVALDISEVEKIVIAHNANSLDFHKEENIENVFVIKEFPRTASGKILRKALSNESK